MASVRHIFALLIFSLVFLQACKIRQTESSAGKFAVIQTSDMWGDGNYLIRHVHAREWTIAYGFSHICANHNLPEDKVFEEAISKVLQIWLAPIKEVAKKNNKNVAITYKYLKLPMEQYPDSEDEEAIMSHHNIVLQKRQALLAENNAKLLIRFVCRADASFFVRNHSIVLYYHDSDSRPITAGAIGDTQFDVGVLLHEMGHAFGLHDTYSPYDKGQPASIMSADLAGESLSEDDIKGIQWLYLYTHAKDKLPQENPCFFTDYEPSKLRAGACVPKHPLITLFKQAEAYDQQENTETAVHLLVKASRTIGEGVSIDYNRVNAQDEDGNTAFHLAIKYYLEAKKKYGQEQSSVWRTNKNIPYYWAAVGLELLSSLHCISTSETGAARQQTLKRLHDDCVNSDRGFCTCIDLQIKNKAGKTARDLAVEAEALDIVQAIDYWMDSP